MVVVWGIKIALDLNEDYDCVGELIRLCGHFRSVSPWVKTYYELFFV